MTPGIKKGWYMLAAFAIGTCMWYGIILFFEWIF